MYTLTEELERFRRGAEVLATVLTGAAGEEVDFAPAPGKWTIRQIMAHLADAEMVGAHRLRLVVAEDNPTLTSFDQDAWTRNLDYARRKPTQSLDTFRRLRAEPVDKCFERLNPLALIFVSCLELLPALRFLGLILRIPARIKVHSLIPDFRNPVHGHIQKVAVM